MEPWHVIVFGLGLAFIAIGLHRSRGTAAPSADETAKLTPPQLTTPLRLDLDPPKSELTAAEHVLDSITPALEIVPQAKPAPEPVRDAKWKRIQQEANSDILGYVEGPFLMFLDTARGVVASTSKETVGPQLRKVKKLKSLLDKTLVEQSHLLGRYNGAADILGLTDWDVLSTKIEPTIDEYLLMLKWVPQGDPMERFATHPSTARFVATIEQLSQWMSSTERAVENRSAELEN